MKPIRSCLINKNTGRGSGYKKFRETYEDYSIIYYTRKNKDLSHIEIRFKDKEESIELYCGFDGTLSSADHWKGNTLESCSFPTTWHRQPSNGQYERRFYFLYNNCSVVQKVEYVDYKEWSVTFHLEGSPPNHVYYKETSETAIIHVLAAKFTNALRLSSDSTNLIV